MQAATAPPLLLQLLSVLVAQPLTLTVAALWKLPKRDRTLLGGFALLYPLPTLVVNWVGSHVLAAPPLALQVQAGPQLGGKEAAKESVCDHRGPDGGGAAAHAATCGAPLLSH